LEWLFLPPTSPIVKVVLRLWVEVARGGRFPRRDQIEPRMLGEDWVNCLVIAVQSPIQLSHFVAVGENLSFAHCPNDSLAGVLLSHLPQVLSERRCLMIEGRASTSANSAATAAMSGTTRGQLVCPPWGEQTGS
jgi:hypothetical protein